MDTLAYTLMNYGGISLMEAYRLTDNTPPSFSDIFDYEGDE